MKEVRHSDDSNEVASSSSDTVSTQTGSFQTLGAATKKACLPRFQWSSGNEKAAVMYISCVSRGVFWFPGNPPPPAMIFFNQGVTPILTPTFTSHLDL